MKTTSFIRGWCRQCFLFICIVIGCQSFAISRELINNEQLIINNYLPAINKQQLSIVGTVTFDGMPMIGVSIAVLGKQITAISGADGKFSIAAETTDTLVFAYVGFKTVTEPLKGRTSLTIVMHEDTTTLQEVTINAGYYKVKDKERTGSIAKITAKDIEKQPISNVLGTLQGRMAGVNITQTTGMPGGGFDIQIRGQNSLRADGNSPLYIIDGVPYASEPIGSQYTSSQLPRLTSPLNNINPGDIESIEVLKDADATAIYGSRGANGVVLVTTKRGKAGKTTFTASLSSGTAQVTRFLDLMHTPQYLAMRREAYANDGISPYPADAYDVNGTWSPTRDTDWQKELLGGNAAITTVQTSLSGGSAQTQFLLSGNYTKETTVFPGDYQYQKGNLHVNVNHESEDKRLKASFTSGYTVQNNNMPTVDFMQVARTLAPNAPALYDAAGNLNWENGTFENPLQYLESDFKARTNDLVANALLSYRLFSGCELKSSFGYTDLRHTELKTLPSTMYNPAYGLDSQSSLVLDNHTDRNSWIVEPQVTYGFKVGGAKMELLAGSTLQQQTGKQTVYLGYGFSSNSLIENPASAGNFSVLQSGETVYKYQAFFGRVNADYKGRYIVNATGRRDGSSRFGTNNRFATFGAIGAAWLFSEEPLLKEKAGFLSFGKLRASYGTSGSDQLGDYQYLDTYSTSGMNYQGTNGLMPTRLFNPNFGWEINRKLELALETGFFKDRLFLTAAWYRNRSSSQLVGIPLPATTGFTSIQGNLDAKVQNTGIELTLRTVNISHDTFSWITSLNLTSAKNELLSFPDLKGSPYNSQFVIGEPLNIVKVFHYTGINPQTGLYQFQDVNGDGVLSATDDKEFVKDLNPSYYGGLQNQIRYGAVQLDFLFQFVKQLGFTEAYGNQLPGMMSNQPASVAEHWQQAGDTGPYQIYSSGANGAAVGANALYSQSDAVIGDASYIRLKNIAVTFDLPSKWTKYFTCRLGVQAQNLLTITSYKGADPEFKVPGFMPPLRVITTSLQLTF
jgi:TonB-linked SusC/RagA family outer membrane protein